MALMNRLIAISYPINGPWIVPIGFGSCLLDRGLWNDGGPCGNVAMLEGRNVGILDCWDVGIKSNGMLGC